MSGVVSGIVLHVLTCAAAVVIADRLAAARTKRRAKEHAKVQAAHVARVIAAERKPAAVLREIRRQVADGRLSFLAPGFRRKPYEDVELDHASAALFGINQELVAFAEMIEAPSTAIDLTHVCALWDDFTSRRRAAHDRLRARRHELERCGT